MLEEYIIVPRRRRQGNFIPNGVSIEKHEYQTVIFLLSYGFDVELICPTNIPKMHSPDLWMLGKAWEMKGPKGKSLRAIEHAFKRAGKQSENVIIDLRRMKVDTRLLLRFAKKLIIDSKRIKTLWVITKEEKMLDIKR